MNDAGSFGGLDQDVQLQMALEASAREAAAANQNRGGDFAAAIIGAIKNEQ